LKKDRFFEIGQELYYDGAVDALEEIIFTLNNQIEGEINIDPNR
jgi:hypothetical protein